MTDIEPLPLGRAMKLIAKTGMRGHEVSAVANATIGLAALSETGAPVPLALLDEWSGYINRIRVSQRPPADQGLHFYEDGAPG